MFLHSYLLCNLHITGEKTRRKLTKTVKQAAEEIVHIFQTNDEARDDFSDATALMESFDTVKSHITMRLVGPAGNKAYLADKLYRSWNDLAIIYVCNVGHNGSVVITNQLASKWRVTDADIGQSSGNAYSVTNGSGLAVSVGSAGVNLAVQNNSNVIFSMPANPIKTEGNVNNGQTFLNITVITNAGGNGAQNYAVQDSVACTQTEMDKLSRQLFIQQTGGDFLVNKTWFEDKKSQGADNEVKSEVNKLNGEIAARKSSGQDFSAFYVEDPVKCVQTTSEQRYSRKRSQKVPVFRSNSRQKSLEVAGRSSSDQ